MTLGTIIDLTSAIVVLLAIIAGGAVLAATRRPVDSLMVLLDLLMAAGLIHLAAGPTLPRVATAASVLAIRRLVSWSLSSRTR